MDLAMICYLFALPAVILFVLFIAWPIVWVFGESLAGPGHNGLTLDAYRTVLSDRVFWIASVNMAVWAAITIPVQMLIGGVLAWFIERRTRAFKGFFRTLFFLPVVTSVSVVSIVWVHVYAPYYGIAQYYLSQIGLEMTSSPLGEPARVIYALILVNIWQWTGFSMLMYIAGLSAIPADIWDAARVDGATGWRLGVFVIVPMLAPATKSLLLLGILGTLQTFPIVHLMTGGGPNRASEVFGTFIFKESFILNDVAKGSALSVLVLFIALALSIAQIVGLGAKFGVSKAA